MRIKTLNFSKRLYCLFRLGKIRLRERHKAVAAAEIIRGKAVEHVRGASRGKNMARPRDEVACGLRRPWPREDSPCAPYALHYLERILSHDLEVLWCEFVDDLQAFGDALRHAAESGVNILAYDCSVKPDEMIVSEPINVKL